MHSPSFSTIRRLLGPAPVGHEAQSQGHDVHAFSYDAKQGGLVAVSNATQQPYPLHSTTTSTASWQTLGDWWSSFDNNNSTSNNKTNRPNWILLAVIDPGWQHEDAVWGQPQQPFASQSHPSRFLQEATITYIVTAVRSRLVWEEDDTTNNPTHPPRLQVWGTRPVVEELLERRYKMQVLQTSHYHVSLPDNNEHVMDRFGPNALLRTPSDVMEFLQWGAEAAHRYGNNHAKDEDNSNNNHRNNNNNQTTVSPVFTAYLFGTQGLDLAIPSRRVYIDDKTRLKGRGAATQINLYQPVGFKPCPANDGSVHISFDKVCNFFLLPHVQYMVCLVWRHAVV